MKLESFVAGQISRYRGDRAALANLRKGAGRTVLQSPPMLLLYTQAPEWNVREERFLIEASHSALTLFALRSVGSAGKSAHNEVAFGTSLRQVAHDRKSDSGTDRSIRELTTAATMDEFLNHLRRSVSLMGQSDVGTNFVTLARDIHNFGRGGDSRNRVLVRWASDYYNTSTKKEGKAS